MLRIFTLAMAVALTSSPALAYQVENASTATPQRTSVLEGNGAKWAPVSRPSALIGESSADTLALPLGSDAESAFVIAEAATTGASGMLTSDGALTFDIDASAGSVLRTDFANLSADSVPSVRVFVGKPDANAGTPLDDPHYAGSVSFYPVPLDGTFTSTLNVGPVLEAAGVSGPTTVSYLIGPGGSGSVEISNVEIVSAP